MILMLNPKKVDFVGVRLSGLIYLQDRSGEFLLNLYPGEKNTREKLSTSIDNLNMRYGKRIINFGVFIGAPRVF